MPFCKKCGTQLDKNVDFCPACGTPTKKRQKDISKKELLDSSKTIKRSGKIYGVINLEDLPVGHIIDNRYKIKEKLGQGGFGAVYRAFDEDMNIYKAIKVIPEAIINDKEAMFDLQNEAQTMIALNHPNIVRVYDFHKTGSIKFIDMEYIEGQTLTEIKLEYKNKQVPENIVQELAVQIASGMSYAHQNGILHKDIKPQNMMVTKDNKVKIMDFGIAETVRTSMSRIQNSSSSGTLVYMSPEQIKGKGLGKESDIYSFGVLLYELLNGNPPFYKGALEYQILNEKPEQLSAVSAKMNDLIMKCLEKDYENRFNDFKEVLKFLGKKDVKHILNIQKDIPAKNNQFIRFMNPFSWLIMSVIIISIFASLSKASQWNIFGMSAYEMEQGRHPFESGIFIGSLISISICFYFIYNKWHKIKNSEMFAYLFGIIILLLIIDEDMVLGFIAWVILSTIVIIIQFREKRIKSLFKAWWMQNLILLLFYSILMLVWEVETILLFLVIFISIIYINGNVYWIVSRGKGKRKIPIIVSIGIIIIIIVCIFAYITIAEKNAWKTAKKSDTEESYKEYLSKYPSTKNSENATEIVAKKWLNRTFSKNVIDSIDTDIFSFKQAGYYFSDTFSTNENDWDEFDTDEKYFQIINGKANMKQLGEGHSFWNWKYISSLNPKNFIIKFEIDLPSTGYGVGIFFSGKETRYRNFIMISLSFFGCGYYDEDKSGEKWVTGDKLLNPVEPDNHILVEARIMGDSIRLYMNSEYIGDVKGIINSGINRIGFVLGGAGPRVQFDNLFVYKLTKRK